MTPELIHLIRVAKRDYPHLDKSQVRALLAGAAAGDIASRDAIVGSYFGLMAQLAFRRAYRLRVDPEDAFQNAVIAALKMIHKNDPDRGSCGTFMHFPVMHGTRDQVNDRIKDEAAGVVGLGDIDPAGSVVERDDRIDIVRRRMELLTPRDRDIVLRWSAGETLEEIGTDLGVSKQRIKQILDRALTTLRGGTQLHSTDGSYRR